MIGEALSQKLAGLTCPDCGAVQAVYTKSGLKSRIRPAAYAEPCPGCGTRLHMVHAPGGEFREGLGWGLAFVVLVGAALLLTGGEVAPQGAALWITVGLGAAALYLFAVVTTGLILRKTRMMVKA